ncbi:MAG TPA: efflux RND transporter periplasmic adaptor subunit [Steroidobacteraceae bacterium]|nr:efflux RND transporter periplasmic adaptor subunit [Steroidobacteraceae bacterium]
MRRAATSAIVLCVLGTASCSRHAPATALVRPVQTAVIHYGTTGEPVSLTGQIQAQNQTNLAFRIGGRLIERRASLGDSVAQGELVARIDSQDERNALSSAQADLAAAQAALVEARNNAQRYRTLVTTGVVSRAQYDDAEQQFAAAQSRVSASTASLQTARDNVAYTELRSNVAGAVTAKGAEPGEVVQAGQMIVQVAQKGGKDAIFNVPANLMRRSPRNPTVLIALADDPSITTTGHVREIAPQADPTTGTYVVKVGLDNPPETMRLGAIVTGSVTNTPEPVATVPGAALIEIDGMPAVWVVDPVTRKVVARHVVVLRYDAAAVVISSGLANGEVVVTAGVHALRPGQQVRLLQPAPG